ncbi:hypothetical protein AMK16_33315 [Streptomyces sp. CB00455]|nr:hypothetical protein AMK16_33315 [Streptomyces sp. CB00455]
MTCAATVVMTVVMMAGIPMRTPAAMGRPTDLDDTCFVLSPLPEAVVSLRVLCCAALCRGGGRDSAGWANSTTGC